ncbi:MAG TPA: hypothetical protein VE172_09955 [Stackebrandtia sp.]|jgi:hypothetical protein|uniref:hypothetical protein n=1 Tax=Stackebrandtia sp. TaxID=2023065 RepID=UPI002D5FFA0E|nr:hypothetical protein [Stackebrandtia sp.]HZE39120.1 hypothetical protein [Stackebrandtia sp.]
MPPPPSEGSVNVDVDAIEDFQPTFNRLDARASTASGKISPATAQGLGSFTDAAKVISDHDRLRTEYQTRLEMLRAAVAVANLKTSRLIANYRRTEGGHVTSMNALVGPMATLFQAVRKD